jgi:hypothetical protein
MLEHVNVTVPEKVWSHALKAEFRKHGTNPCKQKLFGAIFVRGEVVKSVNPHISSSLLLRAPLMVLFRSQRLSRTGRSLDTIPPCRYLVEFALRARAITTPGALATQFHEKCGLNKSKRAPHSRTDPRAIEK